MKQKTMKKEYIQPLLQTIYLEGNNILWGSGVTNINKVVENDEEDETDKTDGPGGNAYYGE